MYSLEVIKDEISVELYPHNIIQFLTMKILDQYQKLIGYNNLLATKINTNTLTLHNPILHQLPENQFIFIFNLHQHPPLPLTTPHLFSYSRHIINNNTIEL